MTLPRVGNAPADVGAGVTEVLIVPCQFFSVQPWAAIIATLWEPRLVFQFRKWDRISRILGPRHWS